MSHPEQERFEVVRGRRRFRVRRERIFAGPGEVVVVAPGVLHDRANVGEETALLRVKVRPALAMEHLSRRRLLSPKTDGRSQRDAQAT
jgi:mannose-6-phosphate isomerase-like protein (cupin superfamily)